MGVTTALVGFTSSFAVVLAGLDAVGASRAQASSGLAVLCALVGLGTIWLTLRHRIPLTLAWSTPGAAILVSAGEMGDGWPAAVGAFLVAGALVVLTAAIPALGRLIARIPAPIAQAMLAGVLLPLCLQPVVAFASAPLLIAPIVLVWIVLARFAPRWAAPSAFALAVAEVIVVVLAAGGSFTFAAPSISLTVPHLELSAIAGIALPLYVVTMASQNVPGVAVMAAHGYRVPWRESLFVTGAGSMLGASAGAHAVNLAAITAALAASEEADRDPARRWIAAHTAGWCYLLLALLAPVFVGLVAAAPPGVIEAVAGLALVGTLASSLTAAMAVPAQRTATVVTFLVAASPIVLLGIGPGFWSLVAGLLVWLLFSARRTGRSGTAAE